MRIVLHIGTPKTGTSSLQRSFHRNRSQLLADGVFYPEMAGIDRHSLLSVPFHGQAAPREYHRKFGADKAAADAAALADWDRIRAEAETLSPDILLLSGEHFFAIDRFDALQDLLDRLFAGIPRRIVCYLRHPADYYLSFLQQTVRASAKLPQPGHQGYLAAIRNWAGIGTLALREFDPAAFRGGLLDDFNRIALDGVLRLDLLREFQTNPSLSAEAVAVLHAFRRYGKLNIDDQHNDQTKALIAIIARVSTGMGEKIAPTRPQLKPAVRAALIRENRADAFGLLDQFGFRFSDPEIYRPGPGSDPETIPRIRQVSDAMPLDARRVQALQARVLEHLLINGPPDGV